MPLMQPPYKVLTAKELAELRTNPSLRREFLQQNATFWRQLEEDLPNPYDAVVNHLPALESK